MRKELWSVVLITVFALALPGSAAAASCNATQTLSDAHGFSWTQNTNGGANVVAGGGTVTFDLVYNDASIWAPTDTNGCSSEDAGRELTWPVGMLSGLEITRKLYGPPSAPGFARFLEFVHNPSGAPITTNLGILVPALNGITRFRGTSSGDNTVTTADTWVVRADQAPPTAPTKPVIGSIWDSQAVKPFGVSALLTSPGGGSWSDDDAGNFYLYNGMTVQPGQTVALMNVELVRPAGELSVATTDTAALGLGPDRL